MTTLRFETCSRKSALGFLRKFYPSATVEDTEESAKAVLDFVEKDVFRIPDPSFHSGAIYPSKNWSGNEAAATAALTAFHAKHSVSDHQPTTASSVNKAEAQS